MTDSAEAVRLKAEAIQAAAEAAVARAAAARVALDTAITSTPTSAVEQAGEPRTTNASGRPPAQVVDAATSAEPAAVAEQSQRPVQEPVRDPAPARAGTVATTDRVSNSQEAEEANYTAQVRSGYSFPPPTLPAGTYLDTFSGSEPATVKNLPVGIPLRLLNRHVLVTGATGADKTHAFQFLAEGLSAVGVPVLLAGAKGDLTGLAEAGASSDKIVSRIISIDQDWTGQPFPIELFDLGGSDSGIGIGDTPIYTTVTEFGPILLSQVLSLNNTQAPALQLVFHWTDSQGLALLDLKDLRVIVDYLTDTKAGKEKLKTIDGVLAATAGAILWEIAALEATGGEAFFDESTLNVRDLMRVSPDGRSITSALELVDVQSQGTLFSIFLMQLLAGFPETLPEIGDSDKSIVVFLFDEVHLLFSGASEVFLEVVVRTVQLIRSKGIGIVFIIQSSTGIPDEILVQLGSRVQHVLYAHTPTNAVNLKKAVPTFPVSPIDLNRVLTSLGTDQAVVNMLDEKGRSAPVVPVTINALTTVTGPTQDGAISQILASSPPEPKYITSVDNESAYELLAQRVQADAEAAEAVHATEEQTKVDAATQETLEKEATRQAARRQREAECLEREAIREARRRQRGAERTAEWRKREVERAIDSAGRQITREVTRSISGTLRHR